MKISDLDKNNAFLAPMAGVSDAAFRKLCKSYGASLTLTEMISVNALSRKNNATLRLLQTLADEFPIAVQLFGQDPDTFVKAIKVLEEYEKQLPTKFDVIDLNFGCPASKIIKQGSGSALMQRPNKIKQIVEAVIQNTNKIVSCKIRSGIDSKHINAVEIAKICESAGASLITVHARTQKQGYTGKADWSVIKQVKNAVSIPVCANGDVTSYETYAKCKKETGADFVMIGRGSFGNPFVFKEIKDKKKIKPTVQQKMDALLDYIDLAKEANIHFNNIKAHTQMFTKGIHGSSRLRNKISQVKSLNAIYKLVKEIETL